MRDIIGWFSDLSNRLFEVMYLCLKYWAIRQKNVRTGNPTLFPPIMASHCVVGGSSAPTQLTRLIPIAATIIISDPYDGPNCHVSVVFGGTITKVECAQLTKTIFGVGYA
jgi:hypothetical protein